MEIVRQQPLQNFNTLNIPASANYFGVVRQASDLATLIAMPEYRSASKTVLGGGSNIVLLNDLPGFVLLNQIKARMVADETEDYLDLRVGGGENWHELVHYCVENGWGGIENLALIPGTAGAAPVQNIGAYGVELKDVLISVECVELNSGQPVSFNNADCEFGYRDSVFKNRYKNRYLISSILIRLQKKPQLKLGYGEINQQLQQKNISQPT
ncbi:MAG TPA: UDP-N-acetylmuramate dehydrogenase, partial [Pseudomonadales bacterium]|nr:UDP-N-acetylmuramate dehydrogenase [Pseudomonadales bacterium]